MCFGLPKSYNKVDDEPIEKPSSEDDVTNLVIVKVRELINKAVKLLPVASGKSKPPKDKSNPFVTYKGSLTLIGDLIELDEYRYKLLTDILVKGYYFDAKYYNFDFAKREIYTLDRSIVLRLNLNFMEINEEHLFFIMSVIQLDLLKILDRDETETILEIMSNYLSLKFEYKFKRNTAIFTRILGGKVVEQCILVITDEEFNMSVWNTVSKFGIYGKSKFDSS